MVPRELGIRVCDGDLELSRVLEDSVDRTPTCQRVEVLEEIVHLAGDDILTASPEDEDSREPFIATSRCFMFCGALS